MVQEHRYGLQTLETGGALEFIRTKHPVTALLVRTMPVLGMAVQDMAALATAVLGMAVQDMVVLQQDVIALVVRDMVVQVTDAKAME